MPSGELEFIVKANSDDFVKGIKAASEQTNRLSKQMERVSQVGRWRNEQANAAREARRAAFERLSVEERATRLAERRLRIERDITRATALGNVRRLEALRTSLAGVRNMQSGLSGALSARRAGLLGDALGYLGMNGAANAVSWLGSKVSFGGLLGAAGGVGLGGLLLSQARSALGLARASEASGFSVGQLRAGRAFASARGYDDPSLPMVERIRYAQGEAQRGSTEMVAAFRAMGISGQDLNRALPHELFLRIAQQLQGGAASAVAFAHATRILGENLRAVAPLLRAGLGGAMAGAPTGVSGSQAILSGLGQDIAGAWAGGRATVGGAARGVAGTAAAFLYRMSGGAAAGLGAVTGIAGRNRVSDWMYGYSSAAAERVWQYMQGGDNGAGAAATAEARLGQVTAAGMERQRQADALAGENATAQAELDFQKMSPADQRRELQRRIGNLRRQADAARDPLQRQQLLAQLIHQQSALQGLGIGDAVGSGLSPTPAARLQADAMAKIGLFRGGFDPANAIRQKQLDRLTQIERLVTQINSRSGGANSAPPGSRDEPLIQ